MGVGTVGVVVCGVVWHMACDMFGDVLCGMLRAMSVDMTRHMVGGLGLCCGVLAWFELRCVVLCACGLLCLGCWAVAVAICVCCVAYIKVSQHHSMPPW